ncbi:hypothetical protein NQZ68_033017 [Dissostichus eleginoides]|nr:hypothetical protein NQZ68_033017 [Dissostichus eleginoides]
MGDVYSKENEELFSYPPSATLTHPFSQQNIVKGLRQKPRGKASEVGMRLAPHGEGGKHTGWDDTGAAALGDFL